MPLEGDWQLPELVRSVALPVPVNSRDIADGMSGDMAYTLCGGKGVPPSGRKMGLVPPFTIQYRECCVA
jgi:hypothetical protein